MTLILTRSDVQQVLTMSDCIEAIAEVMQRFSLGETVMPVRLVNASPSAACTLLCPPSFQLRCARHQEHHRIRYQPFTRRACHHGLVILNETDTGRPLAVMDAGLPHRRAHCRRLRRRHPPLPIQTPPAWH